MGARSKGPILNPTAWHGCPVSPTSGPARPGVLRKQVRLDLRKTARFASVRHNPDPECIRRPSRLPARQESSGRSSRPPSASFWILRSIATSTAAGRSTPHQMIAARRLKPAVPTGPDHRLRRASSRGRIEAADRSVRPSASPARARNETTTIRLPCPPGARQPPGENPDKIQPASLPATPPG